MERNISSGFSPVIEKQGNHEIYHYILPDEKFLHCFFGEGIFGCSYYTNIIQTSISIDISKDSIPVVLPKSPVKLLAHQKKRNYFSAGKTNTWYVQDVIIEKNRIWLTGYLPQNTQFPFKLKNRPFNPQYFSKYTANGIQIGLEIYQKNDTILNSQACLAHSVNKYINIAYTYRDSIICEPVIIFPLKTPELINTYFKHDNKNTFYHLPKALFKDFNIPGNLFEKVNFGAIYENVLYVSKSQNSLQFYLQDIKANEKIDTSPDFSALFKEADDISCIFSFGNIQDTSFIPILKNTVPGHFLYLDMISKESDRHYFNSILLTTKDK